jgi:hypothetical protein
VPHKGHEGIVCLIGNFTKCNFIWKDFLQEIGVEFGGKIKIIWKLGRYLTGTRIRKRLKAYAYLQVYWAH